MKINQSIIITKSISMMNMKEMKGETEMKENIKGPLLHVTLTLIWISIP